MCGLAVWGGGGGPGDGGRGGQQTQGRRQQRGGQQVGGARQPRPLAQRRVQAVEHEGAWTRQNIGYWSFKRTFAKFEVSQSVCKHVKLPITL